MGSSRDAVAAAYDALDAAFDAVLELDFDALSPADKVRLQVRMERNLRRAPTVSHRLLAGLREECDPAQLGAANWPDVLVTTLRITKSEACRRLLQAEKLGPRRALTGGPLAPAWEATAAAQQRGLIGAEHLDLIAKFHRKLPSWVDVGTRAAADAQLAESATGLGPKDLEEAAAMLLAMIDQDGQAPTDAERARKRGIHLGSQQPDGMSRIGGYLTPEARAVFEAVHARLGAAGMCNPDDETPCVKSDPTAEHRESDTRHHGTTPT